MNSKQKILFFDTYIISGTGELGKNHHLYNTKRQKVLREKRGQKKIFKLPNKIDVVKYTLLSYSFINWDHVVIRFELEDKSLTTEFINFCYELFPNATIKNERSQNTKTYFEALSELSEYGNPWIFFSPSNDHPFLASPSVLDLTIESATEFEYLLGPKNNLSIPYSHYQEFQLSASPLRPLWGYYANNFQKKIASNQWGTLLKPSKFLIDCICLYRLSFLIEIFSKSRKEGKVIRPEDTEFYLSKDHDIYIFAPKHELCRHFDSYSGHQMSDFVHPLFIPEGIFESSIEISYGRKSKNKNGMININPCISSLSNKTNSPDLSIFISEMPHFWKSRVRNIVYDQSIYEDSIPLLKKRNLHASKYYSYLNELIFKNKYTYFLIKYIRLTIHFTIKFISRLRLGIIRRINFLNNKKNVY